MLRPTPGDPWGVEQHHWNTKSDETLDAYTFDFQQNLPSPCISTSDIFYSCQLWTYNFGMHDLTTGDGIMHIWNETEARRGSAEVCSCLDRTLMKRKGPTADKLDLFSDECCGQNKNKAMIAYLYSLSKQKKYNKVDHFSSLEDIHFYPMTGILPVLKITRKRQPRWLTMLT